MKPLRPLHCILFAGLMLSALGCKEAIPVVTATSASKITETGTKHFFFSKVDQQLKLYELNISTAMSQFKTTYSFSHAIKDIRIVNNKRLLIDGGASDLYVYDIEKVGTGVSLVLKGSASMTGGPNSGGICATPDGSAVQMIESEGASIMAFKISAEGTASFVHSTAAPGYILGCVSTATSTYAVGYSGEAMKTYSIHPDTKALTSVDNFSFYVSSQRSGPSSIYMTDDQRYIFVTGQLLDSLTVFSVDPTTGVATKIHSGYACDAPNYVQGYAQGTRLLVNCQNAGQAIVPFDLTTNQIGTPTQISNTSTGWYHFSNPAQVVYQYRAQNVDIKKINADGTLSAVTQTLSTGPFVRSFEIVY